MYPWCTQRRTSRLRRAVTWRAVAQHRGAGARRFFLHEPRRSRTVAIGNNSLVRWHTLCIAMPLASSSEREARMSTTVRSSALVFVLLLGHLPLAQSAVISFPSRAAFDAAFPGAVLETWDGLAAGTTFPNGSTTNG